jgi:hypothetical protein
MVDTKVSVIEEQRNGGTFLEHILLENGIPLPVSLLRK